MEFNELDEVMQERIINSSLNLMRDLTESYGAERGMELWDKISDALGGDTKGKIFFGMISGEYNFNGVMFMKVNTGQAVPAIKAIRSATGVGLKQAKDIYDHVRDVGPIRIECKGQYRKDLLKELLEQGHTVR